MVHIPYWDYSKIRCVYIMCIHMHIHIHVQKGGNSRRWHVCMSIYTRIPLYDMACGLNFVAHLVLRAPLLLGTRFHFGIFLAEMGLKGKWGTR